MAEIAERSCSTVAALQEDWETRRARVRNPRPLIGPMRRDKNPAALLDPLLRISAFRYYFHCNYLATEVFANFDSSFIPFLFE